MRVLGLAGVRVPLGRLALAASLGGCTVAEAPPTVSRMLSDAWLAFDDEGDEALQEVVVDALAVLDVAELGRVDGSQEPLTDEHVAPLTFTTPEGDPVDPPDPSVAHPLYLADRLDCSLEAYEAILVYPDQNELYGKYEDYERTYDAEPGAFASGDTDRLSWGGRIVTEVFANGTYVYRFRAEARRFQVPELDGVPGGPALAARTWLPFPAEWDSPDRTFGQDYQLELFVPLEGGDLLHVYPVWREMQTSIGDMTNDTVAWITLNQMGLWDDRTSELCREGLPAR